jgi:hypothetical protein
MSVYIIRHGSMFNGDYEMDIVYYPSLSAAKSHLRKLGFKWYEDGHLYMNEIIGKWAAIDRFSEAKDEKIKPNIARRDHP